MESLVSHRIEYTPMPISATFAGLHDFSKLRLFSSIGNRVSSAMEAPSRPSSEAARPKAVRYRECHRNHAVNSGGHAVDGCGEFMPSGEEGTVEALKCAACECHRNFHRKEVEGETTCEICKNVIPTDTTTAAAAAAAAAAIALGRRELGGSSAQAAAAGGSQLLALPSPAQIISRVTQGAPYLMPPGGPHDSDGGLSGSPSTIKKRFRTKFSNEQKEKMAAFAEKLGWKIQKHDEAAVHEFCAEVGVKRHVLKVWMHNNKHTIGKKPNP